MKNIHVKHQQWYKGRENESHRFASGKILILQAAAFSLFSIKSCLLFQRVHLQKAVLYGPALLHKKSLPWRRFFAQHFTLQHVESFWSDVKRWRIFSQSISVTWASLIWNSHFLPPSHPSPRPNISFSLLGSSLWKSVRCR